MTLLGIIYTSVETTVMGNTSGGHDSLWSLADKLTARMYNEMMDNPPIIVDVGSKFKVFNWICNLKEWYNINGAPPAALFDGRGQLYRQVLYENSNQ